MEFLNAYLIPEVTILCLLLGYIVKMWVKDIDNKWIPVICGVVGGALGIAGMFVMPDFPATDYITAVAVGIVSGLAATGVDQAVKQMTKKESE